ncbi:MAG: heme-degrading domain-containing protein, partial [Paracoccaceae bacterium]
ASLTAEAPTLHLPRFSDADAWQLGTLLQRMAQDQKLAVVISIRTANRILFHAALPGSAALNDAWARRKSNTALIFGEASMLVTLSMREKGDSLEKHGLDPRDYAASGGAVPIVTPSGMVAVATVSGLPEAEDHALVVSAIRMLQAAL